MDDPGGQSGTIAKYLAVAAGGALGSMLRYFLGGTALSRLASPFPTATFVINVSGSFALGFFLTLAAERANLSPVWRLAFAVGFLGAYTTFSTFEYETLRLADEGGFGVALLNVVLSVAVGFAAVWGGMALAHRLAGAPGVSAAAGYERFGRRADEADPAQRASAERDVRDSTTGPRG